MYQPKPQGMFTCITPKSIWTFFRIGNFDIGFRSSGESWNTENGGEFIF